MKRSHSDNTVGTWARQKLDALESYIAAYHRVMQRTSFKLIYIDAFAGAGWSRVRKPVVGGAELDLPFDADQSSAEEEFLAGSPVRALTTGRGFDQYYFFDADARRADLLTKLPEQFPDKNISVETCDANDGVQKLARRFERSPDARGVAFLDPYGPHLHWKTVAALASTRKVDVIINFPLAMAINRLIKRDATVPENWGSMLDLCFGTHEWHELAYEQKADLFGPGSVTKLEGASDRLLSLYHGRLKAAFGYVVAPSLVMGTRKQPLYYLLWASSNARGVPIAEHIMKLGRHVKPPS